MLRHVAAAVIIVGMVSSPAFAQSVVITVTAASADVHKSPSTGSPVIGHTARGAQLPVTRELGSWVRIEWPSVPDGISRLRITARAALTPEEIEDSCAVLRGILEELP